MNTRHSRLIIVFIIPVFCILAMVSVARAAEGVFDTPPGQSSLAAEKSSDSTLTNTLVLTDSQGVYPLGLHLDLLEDPTGQLTIEDVTSPPNNALFTASTESVPVYGYTNSAIWVRFTLDNESRQTIEYLLEMGFPNTQYIDVYSPLPDGGGFAVRHSGALVPVSSRDVVYPDYIFNVNVPLHNQQTYYLRIKSEASMTISLTLWTKNAFINQSGQQLIFHWLIIGGLFILLVYHVFLSLRLREATYIYFVILLASMLIFLLDYTGYLVIYLIPGLFIFKYYLPPLTLAILYISIILFSDALFSLRSNYPKLHLVNIVLLAIWGLFLVLIPFISYLTLARLVTPLQFISFAAIWAIGIIVWRKETISAVFLMLAWLGMTASLLLLLLVRTGIIPSTFFDENIFQLGFILMAVSWSMALADRIKVLTDETASANRDLRNSENKLSQILEGLPLGIVVYDRNQKPTYINQRSKEILTDTNTGIQPDVEAGRSIEQAIDYFSMRVAGSDQKYPVERHPVFRASQGERSNVDDVELSQGSKRLPLEIWANPVIDDAGKVDTVVAVFQDITQRKQAEAELIQHRDHLEELVSTRTAELDQANQQLQLRLDWLLEVVKLQQVIKGESSLEAVYRELSSKIQQLLNAQRVFILRWDYVNDQPITIFNLPHEFSASVNDYVYELFKKGAPLRSRLELGKFVTLTMDQTPSDLATFRQWFEDHNIHALVIAPMMIGQSFLGGLGLGGSEQLKEEIIKSEDLIERMAFDLTSLTQDAILLDKTLTLVASDERNRLARDLHDSVTQMLFTATLLTDVLPQVWRKDPEQGFQMLDKLRRLNRGALAEMRTLLIELRPAALHNIPLSELLSQLTEAITSRSGVPFELSIEKIPLLPDDVQEAFYRIAQEALNNVIKHAQAIRVMVSLSRSQLSLDDHGKPTLQVSLEVQDDGVGFSTGIDKPGHLGITIMRERAATISADLAIDSHPGHGTLVSLVWTGKSRPDI